MDDQRTIDKHYIMGNHNEPLRELKGKAYYWDMEVANLIMGIDFNKHFSSNICKLD